MAAVLGVAPGDMKVVSAYEGSAIIVFTVISDPEVQEEPVDVAAAEETFTQAFTSTDGQTTPISFMESEVIGAAVEDTVIEGELPPPPSLDDEPENCIPTYYIINEERNHSQFK